MIKTKLKAFFVHFLLSLILVVLIGFNIIYFWFPLEYLNLTEFKEISILIISVDLVLGPLLTFVIFQPNKKSIYFDLSVIALFQILAFTYGTYTLFQIHPVYLTFSGNSFSLISAKDVNPENSKYNEYKISKLSSMNLAYAEMPTDLTNLLNVIVGNKTKGNKNLEQRTEFYKPYSKHINDILKNTLDASLIFSNKKINKNALKFLSKHKNIDNFSFLPLRGVTKNAILALDKKSAQPIEIIDIDPWKYAKK